VASSAPFADGLFDETSLPVGLWHLDCTWSHLKSPAISVDIEWNEGCGNVVLILVAFIITKGYANNLAATKQIQNQIKRQAENVLNLIWYMPVSTIKAQVLILS